jgi:hypothetical protein
MNSTKKLLSDAVRSKEHMAYSVHRRLKDERFVRFAGRIKFTLIDLFWVSELNEKLC